MFIEPRSATALAAVTSVKPCSIACGMRCVPTSPFEVYPQTKKLPAMRHRGAEHAADRSGAETDGDAPEEVELPQVAHEQQSEQPADDQQIPDEHHAPRSEAIDERAAERSAESERQDAQRDRRRDRGAAPAEFALERSDDDAGCGAHCLRREKRDERDDDNEPRVVEALHGCFEV